MKELKGCNGARIVINPAPFKQVKRLRQVIAEELKQHNIDIGNPASLKELFDHVRGNVSEYLNLIKDILLGLETSEKFSEVMWACMLSCTYNDITIKESLFDDLPAAREDYDLIQKEVVQVNLAPFIKPLAGLFVVQSDQNINDQ